MKKLLLSAFLLLATNFVNAQIPVDLARIETLAKDSTNSEFHFDTLKEKFKTKPQELSILQLQLLYYHPLNTIGSLNYDMSSAGAYADFKSLKFKKFIAEAEEKLEKMPANLTLLFLLSLAYGETKEGKSKANGYNKKFKLVLESLMVNKSLTDEDHLIELNCITDQLIILNVLGIDTSKLKYSTKANKGSWLNTYEKDDEKIQFKVLVKQIL